MTGGDRAYLLLTCKLGVPRRNVLTPGQFQSLMAGAKAYAPGGYARELTLADLEAMGCDSAQSEQILALLEDTALLESYCSRAARHGCVPLTGRSASYPQTVRQRLGAEAPANLWAKGDLSILEGKKIALVGSRALKEENRRFAEEAGRQAALQGYTLVSGNARGADTAAQEACLAAGGKVISVVADSLARKAERKNLLYLSENGFDQSFSALRALSRNRVIHAMGDVTLVAQCSLEQGGTWSGTTKNLRSGWSRVCLFDDGSEASNALAALGAEKITCADLAGLDHL